MISSNGCLEVCSSAQTSMGLSKIYFLVCLFRVYIFSRNGICVRSFKLEILENRLNIFFGPLSLTKIPG